VLNKEIISEAIPSLNPGDPVIKALTLMTDFHIIHLPVVSENKLIGLVSEDDLLNVTDDQLPLSHLEQSFSKLVVHENAHFMEAVQCVNEFNLTVVPVVDKELSYLGSISAIDLLKYLGRFTGVNDPGALIILEMDKVSFSFSEISKLVETNDAQITQLNTYSDLQTGAFFVTLKINKFEVTDIVATFQRYEYHVKYYFGEELFQNELRSNYDHLMNYLNI
jgi:acetoin utilization protein AcuB